MTDAVLDVTGSISVGDPDAAVSGAVATVKLVDKDGEVLAGTAFEVDAVPADFSLHVDPATVARPDRLFLWAMLRAGDTGWGTVELAQVRGDHAELVLTPIGFVGSR